MSSASLRYDKFHEAIKVSFESLESDLQKIFNGEEPEHNSEPSTDPNDRQAKNPAEEDDLKVRDVEITQL